MESENLEVKVMSGEKDNGQQDSNTNLDAFFENLFQDQDNGFWFPNMVNRSIYTIWEQQKQTVS